MMHRFRTVNKSRSLPEKNVFKEIHPIKRSLKNISLKHGRTLEVIISTSSKTKYEVREC